MTKIEIKTIWGEVIFTYEKDNNTVKDTVVEAVKQGAYLRGANLGEEWGKLERNTDVFIAGPLGSRNDYITFFHTDKGIFVRCGCFNGTIDEFVIKVKETHGESKHAKNYLAIAEFVKQKYQ